MFFIAKIVVVIFLYLQFSYAAVFRTKNIIEYYENLIATESEKALKYQTPKDAKIYEAINHTPIDLGCYDFIVIGAGSTGTVVANRLSEEGNWKVLLLEAGKFSNSVNQVPALYPLGVFSDYNWGFQSIPQTTACLGAVNESCLIPTGRGIGGTSLINGLIYSRGHPTEFNSWAKLTNDPTWAYENVLEYFKKSENFHQTDTEAPVDWNYHRKGGNLHVEHHNPSIDLKYVFLAGNKELGLNITDYNSPEQLGASVVQYNTRKGKRHDHGSAFITPALNRINLEVLSESYVTKIVIDNKTKEATGCVFTRFGETYTVSVGKEVILSAGVISTPKILMLSGIGPKEHLELLNISVIEDLPVGSALRDHVSPYGIQFSSNMSKPNESLQESILAYLNGTGPLTSNTLSHVVGWYKSSKEKGQDCPDLEIVTDLTGSPSELGRKFLGWKDDVYKNIWGDGDNVSFSFNVILLHARSKGSVRLKSSNPFDYPLVDYNLLSDPAKIDMDILYEGITIGLKLIETEAFKKIGAKFEAKPLMECNAYEFLSKDYWYCYMRQMTLAVFHPVGTCPMGLDPLQGAVVDSNLRVFGVRKLRVADASVFPSTISGHPSATCTMIGEKVSDVIKAEYLE